MSGSKEFGVVEQRTWQIVTKNNDGEAIVHDLVYERKLPEVGSEEYSKLFVTQAPHTVMRSTKRVRPKDRDKVTAIIPDVQIGFRDDQPFHDDRAMMLARLAVREAYPDEVVVLGDLLDLPSVSKYPQRQDWQGTVQRSLDTAHLFLAGLRADVPDAKIVLLGGNHERRWEDNIRKNAAELLGIRRANAGAELGVLTLDYLMRLDELGVEYHSGYPSSHYWVQPNIKAVHGTTTGRSGETASRLLNNAVVSTVQGHSHKLEVAYKTLDEYAGPRTIWAMVAGALCKTDSSVPSASLTTDSRNELVPQQMNWQQGIAFIESNSSVSYPTLAPITEEGIRVNGRTYQTSNA